MSEGGDAAGWKMNSLTDYCDDYDNSDNNKNLLLLLLF
jgi:hypothetical protein